MKIISDNLNIKLETDKVDISFFNKVKLNNVYIEDLNQDTLLYADQITASIIKLPNKKRIPINTLTLEKAKIYFLIDSLNVVNIKFFIDELRRKDTTKPKKIFTIRNIKLNDSKFCINRYYSKKKKYGMTDYVQMKKN